MSSDTMILERYRLTKLNEDQAPYRRDPDGHGWITNRMPIYVQRQAGKPRNVSLKPEHGYVRLLTDDEVARVEKVAHDRKWKIDLSRADIEIARYPFLEGDLDCNADLLRRLNAVGRDLREVVFVRSGRRTLDEQWALYRQLGPKIAAFPSATAPHVLGIGADCGIRGVNIGAWPGARQAMLKHGLCLRVVNENWHVEVGGRDRWAENWLP